MLPDIAPVDSHILLYRNPRGPAMRRIALGSIVLGAIFLIPLVVLISVRNSHGESLLFAQLLGTLTIVAITSTLTYSSVSLARRYVTYLELWPQSNLALVRTAGLCSEQTHLISWHAFRANRSIVSAHTRDPYLRVHLRTGRLLAFEQAVGEAPLGWTALQSFTTLGTIPESTAGQMNHLESGQRTIPLKIEGQFASHRA